jgi:hypothetical protein
MSEEILRTYLNDHLAGSVAAVELLDHVIKLRGIGDRRSFFQDIRSEIAQDQKVLQDLLQQIGGRESRVRQAAAWISEKLGQAKLALDDPGDNQLRLFEALETLALGIQGKLLLWRALGSAAAGLPALRTLDLPALERRARAQFEQVDAERLRLARSALAG